MSIAISLVSGDAKSEQIRSYVERDLKSAVHAFSSTERMTDSQGMRRLIISGLIAEGHQVHEIDPSELSDEERAVIAKQDV